MKKLLFMLLFIPFISSAQPPFVIHMPFHGEPLFCHETACLRKAVMAKKIKKNKHKREMAVRKLSRKKRVEIREQESSPMEYRVRPKFE